MSSSFTTSPKVLIVCNPLIDSYTLLLVKFSSLETDIHNFIHDKQINISVVFDFVLHALKCKSLINQVHHLNVSHCTFLIGRLKRIL